MGRGAQCVLQHKPDVYHVFVYAPLKERILRLKQRLEKGADIEERIRTVDGERARYLQQYWGKSWCNPHLYDLMVCSHDDEDSAARAIVYAMTGQTKEELGEQSISKSEYEKVGCPRSRPPRRMRPEKAQPSTGSLSIP